MKDRSYIDFAAIDQKEIVGYNKFGGTYEYYPCMSSEEYRSGQMSMLVGQYFNNSFKQVVNFFSEHKNLKPEEVNEVIKMPEVLKQKKNG